MGTANDLTGRVFGRLTVQQYAYTKNKKKWWLCVCLCGSTTHVKGAELTRTAYATKSCGCLHAERTKTHGLTGTRTYRAWRAMLGRCYNTHVRAYKDYGGRGLKVQVKWHKFEAFVKDMGICPKGFSLERINNEKGYVAGNCTWATQKQQNNNKRSSRRLTVGTLTATMAEWAEMLGCPRSTVRERLDRGWPVEAACTLPPRGKVLHIEET
jgi:hypothetical protein